MRTITTRVGRSLTGDYDHFGLRVFRDLAGSTSYLGLIAFSISGRRLTREQEGVLDDLAVSSHVPEPRVWPIKLSRLGASFGRTMPGLLCGSVALDCDLVGSRVAQEAAELLVDLQAHLASTSDHDDEISSFIATRPRLLGFGVPQREVDERVVSFRGCLSRRGWSPGHVWSLAERFWQVVKRERRVEVNIVGATAAICLDLGFAPHEIVPLAAVLLQPTMVSNAAAGAREQPEALRRLDPSEVKYVGPGPRQSARAAARRDG